MTDPVGRFVPRNTSLDEPQRTVKANDKMHHFLAMFCPIDVVIPIAKVNTFMFDDGGCSGS